MQPHRRHSLRALLLLALLGSVPCACGPPPSAPASAAPQGRSPSDPDVLQIGDSELRVSLDSLESEARREMLRNWTRRSATWVADYCNGFPVPDLEIALVRRGRRSVGFGFHQDGRLVRINVGSRASEQSLRSDWVMIHELLHTGFPDLEPRYRWMQEGMSTYVEPIVRASHQAVTPEVVWGKWYRNMKNGRPKAGDRGLDNTFTWGRTYWGGALFWFVVDVRLRAESNNEASLQDVVRGILAAGGNGRADWTTARVVETADRATGTRVVSQLYREMATGPGDVDLDSMWSDLGIASDGDSGVVFDDQAPLAHVRVAILQQP